MTSAKNVPPEPAHAGPRRKLRFDDIVQAIRAQQDALRGAGGAAEALDRRAVLARLCAAFEMDEALLLLRGFDRAYRRVIEGV